MAVLPYVIDGTAENFARVVLENSRRGPVAVNFWSPRAGPCLVLMPRLVRIAQEFGGRILLVMLNTDDHGELIARLGVRALPLVQVFRAGEVKGSLQGVSSEADLRALFSRHAPVSDAVMQAHVRGDTAQAARLAAQSALERPGDPYAALRVARLLVLDKRPREAFALLDALPSEARSEGEIAALHAHLALIATLLEGGDEPPISQADGLFREAAAAVAHDEYETACERLIACAACDPDYRQGLALRAARALAALPMADEARAHIDALLASRR
ncbi:tetratricopeptide repeat protein [Acidiferrobacter thiooxydans]|uniref:thioredoxin domain-containing protein n=1 Tax=Acidiferrobacter thiooxydans TaxID=163359 RepID=UPI0008243D35|nr:thioredoxin domain-containing protein [Acidiferrobacter thiooxydans]UEO00244.1 tetratricopeptide repeat protein [Acidiferrobacter thiooxydans]